MAQKKGLGALEFARIPATKPTALVRREFYMQPGKYEAISKAIQDYKFNEQARGLADVEFAADRMKEEGFRPGFELGLQKIEKITGGDYGDVINTGAIGAPVELMDKEGNIRELFTGETNPTTYTEEDYEDLFGLYMPTGVEKVMPGGDNLGTDGEFLPGIYTNPKKTTSTRPNLAMDPSIFMKDEALFNDLMFTPQAVEGDDDVLEQKKDVGRVLGHEIGHLGFDELKEHPRYGKFVALSNAFTRLITELPADERGFLEDGLEHSIIYAMDEGSRAMNQKRISGSPYSKKRKKIFDQYMKFKDSDITTPEIMDYIEGVLTPEGGLLQRVLPAEREEKIDTLKKFLNSGEATTMMALLAKKMADDIKLNRRKGLPSLVSDSKSTHGHSHD